MEYEARDEAVDPSSSGSTVSALLIHVLKAASLATAATAAFPAKQRTAPGSSVRAAPGPRPQPGSGRGRGWFGCPRHSRGRQCLAAAPTRSRRAGQRLPRAAAAALGSRALRPGQTAAAPRRPRCAVSQLRTSASVAADGPQQWLRPRPWPPPSPVLCRSPHWGWPHSTDLNIFGHP